MELRFKVNVSISGAPFRGQLGSWMESLGLRQRQKQLRLQFSGLPSISFVLGHVSSFSLNSLTLEAARL